MANNKVIFGDTTIMDITDTTAEASDVAAGEVFYNKSGVRTLGTGDYMSKVTNPTANDILVTDANGQAIDSEYSIEELQDRCMIDYEYTSCSEVADAFERRKILEIKSESIKDSVVTHADYDENTISYNLYAYEGINSNGQLLFSKYNVNSQNEWSKSTNAVYTATQVDQKFLDEIKEATETTTGTIKLNSNQAITLNANGQLEVGGRLGQFPDGGVYYPTTIEPTSVGSSSFLMTDGAKGASVAQRTFAILAGANITCKSAAAGSTTYRVSNTQTNRFALAAVVGGRAALSQADAAENGTAAITSIAFANGGSLTAPYFGANESSNDILVTLDRSINPSSATTQIRVYGKNNSTDNILVGQGVGANGGKVISLGQSCYAGGNQNVAIGNAAYVNANNSVGMGHTMLVNKQYCLSAGQGHDFTSGANGTTAVGTWSEIMNKTKFVVGNGTADNLRSNIFEVRDDNGTAVIMKSPNGTKYKLAVDDSGNLTTTAV